MRIKSIFANDCLPVKKFVVEDISDLVVIAGPNGVGKSRLVSSLITQFQSLHGGNVRFIIEATVDEEAQIWGKKELDTESAADSAMLRSMLQQNRQRRNLRSSVFYYESNRSIQKIQPLTYQWEMPDPWEEQVAWSVSFGGLAGRFQDTLHAIFKKIQIQKTLIANQAINLKEKGHESMRLEFSDPLEPFREAFYKLLGPKKLIRADLQGNTLWFEYQGEEYNINALSSGEREVLNITFDFLLRQPSNCIVFLDEPELHLHPELSSKLISTLKSAGVNNQFILCSHSPDIISSSLDDTVIFLTPNINNDDNQAVILKSDDHSSEALNRLGHSVGVVSLGKKIVLIEGNKASLDKQTYVHILKNQFPDLVLLPSGGKSNLSAFKQIADEVLNKSLWGINFYMLADRDCVRPGMEFPDDIGSRFQILSKYHLENYFLDQNLLAKIFENMEPHNSWLRDPYAIEEKLREIAKEHISYATSLVVANEIRMIAGNVDVMPKNCQNKTHDDLLEIFENRSKQELSRIQDAFNLTRINNLIKTTYEKLYASIDGGNEIWKSEVPGKAILSTFAGRAQIPEGRLKTLYIQEAAKADQNPFQEIVDIFKRFSNH